jgi:hypothetical protein
MEIKSVCNAYTFASDDGKCQGCDPKGKIYLTIGSFD